MMKTYEILTHKNSLGNFIQIKFYQLTTILGFRYSTWSGLLSVSGYYISISRWILSCGNCHSPRHNFVRTCQCPCGRLCVCSCSLSLSSRFTSTSLYLSIRWPQSSWLSIASSFHFIVQTLAIWHSILFWFIRSRLCVTHLIQRVCYVWLAS